MCFGKLILVAGDKEELEGKIKVQGIRSFVSDEIQSTIVHVLLHGLTMRQGGLHAHLQGLSTTDTYNITKYERTFIITVNVQ